MKKFAKMAGVAEASARTIYNRTKAKLKAAPTGDGNGVPVTPKKTPRKKRAAAADGEAETNGSPTKKTKATLKAKKGAGKGTKKGAAEDQDCEFADITVGAGEAEGIKEEFHEVLEKEALDTTEV